MDARGAKRLSGVFLGRVEAAEGLQTFCFQFFIEGPVETMRAHFLIMQRLVFFMPRLHQHLKKLGIFQDSSAAAAHKIGYCSVVCNYGESKRGFIIEYVFLDVSVGGHFEGINSREKACFVNFQLIRTSAAVEYDAHSVSPASCKSGQSGAKRGFGRRYSGSCFFPGRNEVQ